MFFLFSLFDLFFNYSLIRSALVCTLLCLSMHVFNLKNLFFLSKKKSKLPLPPGPYGLPFLGYLPFLKNEAHITFTELSKTYGPIYQLKLGNTRVVVLSSAKYVREAFRQQVFSGRPSNELTKILKGFGVVNSNGELWREQRSFIHSVLKDFGAKSMLNGKIGLEKLINDEMQSLINDIRKLNGGFSYMRPKLARTVTNVVCSLLMGFRFHSEEDKHFKRLIELMDEGFKLLTITMVTNFFPFTRHLPYISSTFQKIKNNHAESGRYFKKITDQHRETLDEYKIRDVCDAYIKEQIKKDADERKSYFSSEQLVQIMNDMFSAGLETVANTLDWTMIFFVLYPNVQTRIQQEIDQVIGTNRLPELEDLPNMPFTEATMCEVMRRSSIVALGHVHSTLSDAKLGDFRIPKNTHLYANLYGIHMDEEHWKNPDQFDPTRFLTEDGKLSKSDNFMPFSVGRRMCLGDVLTKMEFFLFITNILMNFNVTCDANDKPSLDVFCATLITPNKPFGLRFIPRESTKA